jgi:DNA excision repair protein ERCC-2
LPRWINQYITETAANLSTDMAIGLSKLFMRTISQKAKESQTGVSLWTLEDIGKAQEKQREEAAERERRGEGGGEAGEDEDGWMSDGGLAEVDLEDV